MVEGLKTLLAASPLSGVDSKDCDGIAELAVRKLDQRALGQAVTSKPLALHDGRESISESALR
ncbi:hypothetical protein OG992_31850 [Micromonospora sp. NBC_00362]|uniref:hypothetical protein n=1 Tax=Micromonospora sp. NBC_00362 TaxID=2975975 RepID=UPI002259C139|nr:hypothetical protein [Micromonospora sp. NBC_00362]MCX5121764.1 hypothetical protein [Micromonospora sp. NBC_00362]